MQDYQRVITPYLRPELVGAEALSSIQTVTQFLPPTSLAGFECRLGDNQFRVDFQVNVPRLPFKMPERFLTSPEWRAFMNLSQNWLDPTSFLYQNVSRLALEFDLPTERSSLIPIPCIFLDLNQTSTNDTQKLISKVFSMLNHPIPLNVKANIQICNDSLPNAAKIRYVGIMLSRSTETIKIVIQGIPQHLLVNYLVQIGWTASTDYLSELVLTLSKFSDSIALSLDIGETIHSKVGLECFLTRQPYCEPRWYSLLNFLVKKELCTSAKHNALLLWPGISQRADQPSLWPSNLNWGDCFVGSKALSVFWRVINHVKVSYHPSMLLEAKAYLAFGHSWLTLLP